MKASPIAEEVTSSTPSPPADPPESWEAKVLEFGGISRTYHVYARTSGSHAGIMVFLHDNGMSDDFPLGGHIGEWHISSTARTHGFLAVVPEGSKDRGRFGWKLLPSSAADEVGFIQAVLKAVGATYSIPASAPRIALGYVFSNSELGRILF